MWRGRRMEAYSSEHRFQNSTEPQVQRFSPSGSHLLSYKASFREKNRVTEIGLIRATLFLKNTPLLLALTFIAQGGVSKRKRNLIDKK